MTIAHRQAERDPLFDSKGVPRHVSDAEREQIRAFYWLTPEEAAAYLRISRAGIYRRLADGSVPSVRLGKLIRIRTSDLDALVGSAA